MSRFAQHTRLVAAAGRRDDLVAKFLESTEIQRDNPDCELMLVSTAPGAEEVVYLTEIWSSEQAWERARSTPAIQQWAKSMPELVGGPPETVALDVAGSIGLAQDRRPTPP